MAKLINDNNKFSNEENLNKYKKYTYISGAITFTLFFLYAMAIFSHNISNGFPILILVMISSVIFKYVYGKYEIYSSGNKGEKNTMQFLTELSDDYSILHNVNINKGEKKTELDFVIISPFGLQIIEVKNHNGKITGDKDASTWEQHKIGQQGTPYTATMKNPLKQLGFQKYLLSEILKDNNIKTWVDGYVLMPTATSINVNSEFVLSNNQSLLLKLKEKNKVQLTEKQIVDIISLLKKGSSYENI